MCLGVSYTVFFPQDPSKQGAAERPTVKDPDRLCTKSLPHTHRAVNICELLMVSALEKSISSLKQEPDLVTSRPVVGAGAFSVPTRLVIAESKTI